MIIIRRMQPSSLLIKIHWSRLIMKMIMIHDGGNDEDDGGDEHEDVSHDNLMVVWALSAGYCLKFPSFSSQMEFFDIFLLRF